MTTIAYKHGVIAYDSRLTRADEVISDSANKMVSSGDSRLFWAGRTADGPVVLDALIAGSKVCDAGDGSGIAIINGTVFAAGLIDKELWKLPISTFENVAAFGSGADYAIGAMDMGATALEAVKIAARRDVFTGGKIRTVKYKLGEP